MSNPVINIGIVEDNLTYKTNVEAFLNSIPNFNVKCTFGSIEEIKPVPDLAIILLDITLPGKSGLEGLKEIKKIFPAAQIIMLTAHEDSERIFTALKAGASAYISKKTTLSKLAESINIVYNGGSFMSPDVAKIVFDYFSRPSKPNAQLTDRQLQIIHGIVDGKSYKLIASDLLISIDTVRDHIRKIYKSLNVNSKTEVITKYYKGEI